MKPSRAKKLRPDKTNFGEGDAVPVSNEDYIIGQVANSLCQKSPAVCDTGPLVQLFSVPGSEKQPVYVAVPRETKKRKHTEEEIATDIQNSIERAPLKNMKKAKKKVLSPAEARLASRECALDQTDEDEVEKERQIKQKLAAKRLSASDADDGIKKKKMQINIAEEMLKNKRTVFVGNLPVSCTAQIPAEDTLSKKLAAIKQKVHPDRKYVNAYVVFKEECAAVNALKRNGTEFANGFHIRVDLASESTSHDNKRSVFVGNLPYDIDDDTVRQHFSECGTVTGVRIVRDRNTGIGKGFGYVLFKDTDAVHLALKLNNSEIKGRKLRVKHCIEKAQQKSSEKNVKNLASFKNKKTTSLNNVKRYSSDTFVGEKAAPVKKSKKLTNIAKKKIKKHK
ncbi:RNA-binding protein 34 isoform X2 [Sphaerodactylus townsendi]|uniref:RNA-binding protein 34 isoform X2 n=1 Tax=Sphaerodactylus townsendi TaxID=933632 RepID=UPI002026F893|nr:RNA-binding protein 34 isoform X2 [Sphaerodactylus townsendi]